MENQEIKKAEVAVKENKNETTVAKKNIFNDRELAIPILAVLIVVLGGWILVENSPYAIVKKDSLAVQGPEKESDSSEEIAVLAEKIIPSGGYEIPVKWNNLGKQLVDSGVIDKEKFEELYSKRGEMGQEQKDMLYADGNGEIRIDSENSGFILNVLWALGLGNRNGILEKGPMMDKQYGGADKFASTGGWTLSSGKAMDHYSKHKFIPLTAGQQALVEKVSKGIFRPCCGNSTYFPDCNHGMAMLGLLQLLANQGATESQMYDVALKVNSYWFPDTYITLAKYFSVKGTDWKDVDAKTVLGAEYSSAQGFKAIQQQVAPIQAGQGGSCGV